MSSALRNTAPCERIELWLSASERAAEVDRAYFAAHPGARRYWRAPLVGEFPGSRRGDRVVVYQYAPGVRMREFRPARRVRR